MNLALAKFVVLALIIVAQPALSETKTKTKTTPKPKAQTPEMVVNLTLAKIQKVWDKARTYQADFNQTVISKTLGARDESRGKLYILKPSKLRWQSTTDGSAQIMNGKRLTHIQPNAQRGRTVVDIYKDFSKNVDAKFYDFLAGNIKLKNHYNAKLLDSKGNIIRLRLTPKKVGDQTYIAEVDKKSYLLVALITDSADTRTLMRFSNIKINIPVKAELFEYKKKKEHIIHEQ